MSEQAKLPEGVEMLHPYDHPELGAQMRVEPTLAGGYVRSTDLPAIIAQRDEEWRSGLLGDEAVEAVAERQARRWEDIPELVRPERRFRARGDLQAALDKAAPDGGGE